MQITPSKLRENIYRLLDKVANTGVSLEIKRKGKVLKIICETEPDKLKNLKKHSGLLCDPEEIVHIDWSKEWSAEDSV